MAPGTHLARTLLTLGLDEGTVRRQLREMLALDDDETADALSAAAARDPDDSLVASHWIGDVVTTS